jgi:plasmid stability protein
MHNASMPVTLTIKNVPDLVAEALRSRAAVSHRSLQGELMAILEDATTRSTGPSISQVRQPDSPRYAAGTRRGGQSRKTLPAHGRRMTLAEAWERARRAGPPSRSASPAIVRKLRDERHGG